MLNKINEILAKFNRVELAFFAKYQLDTYLPSTKDLISEMLIKEKLDKAEIERIIKEIEQKKETSDNQCPRCKSTKILIRQEEFYNNSESAMLEVENYRTDILKKDIFYCQVCGLNVSEYTPNLLKRLLRRILK